jgi:hypothetical protein
MTAFDLEKLFIPVFAPQRGDVATLTYDLPHGLIRDIVYARGNPILCRRLDFIFPDDSKKTLIVEGELQLPT